MSERKRIRFGKFSLGVPGTKAQRTVLGGVLSAGGFLGFLPILGFWMLPLGLALLALDLPFLRGPMARCLAYINGKLAGT